ncbi:MAG: DUF29 domain-containing protein [Cytophagaceae bacterium]|nr:DUF29 domain-containing protein [Cytophagaceae bacterium]
MKRDWEELTATSYHDSVTEIKEAFENQEFEEVSAGLNSLLESMSQELRRALKSQLLRLMMHVVKWKIQPDGRSSGWELSIVNARFLIREIMEEKPSLTREVIEDQFWDKLFEQAKKEAWVETRRKVSIEKLTWEDVFETEYTLGETA